MILRAALCATGPAMAQTAQSHDHGHAHSDAAKSVYAGYFDDAQVADRPLPDWASDWQSVYPLLRAGALDPMMATKAAKGDRTAAEYRAYYETGYRTDVDCFVIAGDEVTFHGSGGAVHGHYASDGHEILTYAKGNRGLRFTFRKTGGNAAAAGFLQFSDHAIAPVRTGHYHLYWGDDRAAPLAEVTHWPTYHPAALGAEEIRAEMLWRTEPGFGRAPAQWLLNIGGAAIRPCLLRLRRFRCCVTNLPSPRVRGGP